MPPRNKAAAFSQSGEKPLNMAARLDVAKLVAEQRELSRVLSAREIIRVGKWLAEEDVLKAFQSNGRLGRPNPAGLLIDLGAELDEPKIDFVNALIELSKALVQDEGFAELMRKYRIKRSVLLLRDTIKKVGELLQQSDYESKEDARKFLETIMRHAQIKNIEALHKRMLEPNPPAEEAINSQPNKKRHITRKESKDLLGALDDIEAPQPEPPLYSDLSGSDSDDEKNNIFREAREMVRKEGKLAKYIQAFKKSRYYDSSCSKDVGYLRQFEKYIVDIYGNSTGATKNEYKKAFLVLLEIYKRCDLDSELELGCFSGYAEGLTF